MNGKSGLAYLGMKEVLHMADFACVGVRNNTSLRPNIVQNLLLLV